MHLHRHRFTPVVAVLTFSLVPAVSVAATAFPSIIDVEAPGAPGKPITTAQANTPIVIVGQNLGAKPGLVIIGIYHATPTSWSDSQITVTLPEAASYPYQGGVYVSTVSGLGAHGPQFTITAPPPSTTTTVGSWQVITFQATGTPTSITDRGAMIFNGPGEGLTSQPFIVPDIYAPTPAPTTLGTMTAGQNAAITAAVEEAPAAGGSRVIQCYGYAQTGTPGQSHAVQATVTVDPSGKMSVKWTDLNPTGAYASQIYAASLWGAVGEITASKGQPPTPYIWKSSSPSQAEPIFGAGPEAQGSSFWDPITDALSKIGDAAFTAVNSSGKSVGNQYSVVVNGTSVTSSVKAFDFKSTRNTPLKYLPGRGGDTLASGLNDVWDTVGWVNVPGGVVQAGLWVCSDGTGDVWYDLSGFSSKSSLALAINNRRWALLDSPATSYGNLVVADVSNPAKPAFTPVPGPLAGFGPNGATAVLSDGSAVAGVTATSNVVVGEPLGPPLSKENRQSLSDDVDRCRTLIGGVLAHISTPDTKASLLSAYRDLSAGLDHLDEHLTVTPADAGAAISYLTSARDLMQQAVPSLDSSNATVVNQCADELDMVILVLYGSFQ